MGDFVFKVTATKVILIALMIFGLYFSLTPWTGGPYGVYEPLAFGWMPRFLWVSMIGQLITWASALLWFKYVK